jgi:hypothetical protein
MRRKFLMLPLSCLLAVVAGCNKDTASQPSANKQPSIEVCALLTKEEIHAVQGSPLKDTQSSEHVDKGIRSSHCFYVTENSSKFVSLLLTQKAPDYVKGQDGPKDVWADMFNRESDEEKEGKTEGKGEKPDDGEEDERPPAKKIGGLGDDAYWVSTQVASALFVLKKDMFIRISLGGTGKDDIDKSKILAEKAIQRL